MLIHRFDGRPTSRREVSTTEALDEGIGIRSFDSGRTQLNVVEGFNADAVAEQLPAVTPDEWPLTDASGTAELPGKLERSRILEVAADEAAALHNVRSIRAAIRAKVRRTLVITPRGEARIGIEPIVRLIVRVALRGSDDVTGTATGDVGLTAGALSLDDAARIARRASESAEHRLKARRPHEGPCPLVMEGGWNGIWIHEAIGHMLEADVFPDGPFAADFGRIVAPDFVTIVDDPGPRKFDDEGVPARCRPLVSAGQITGLMRDQAASGSTGNGRRQSFRHRPMPRQWGARLEPRAAGTDELLHGIRRGLYLVDARTAQVERDGRFRMMDGIGFLIENGRLARPVAGFSLEGSARDALRSIEAVGHDGGGPTGFGGCVKNGQQVEVRVGSPGVRLRELRVCCP